MNASFIHCSPRAWAGAGILCLALLMAGRAAGHDGPPAEGPGEGGEDRAHYSADRRADFKHMTLHIEMSLEDMMQRRMSGRVTHTFEPRGAPLSVLSLNAVGMRILSVERGEGGAPMAHEHRDGLLWVPLDPPLAPGRAASVTVRYEVRDAVKGLHHILPSASRPERPLMVYTMSEPLEARHWMPCHDWPNERWTTDMFITVPEGFQAVANGLAAGRRDLREGGQARVEWHWRNRHPLDPHLMGFGVGRMVLIEEEWRELPVHLYTQPGLEEAARHTFRRVPRLLEFMSRRIGVPFPFSGYHHMTVVDHHHGGMEHGGFSFVDPMYVATGPEGDWDTERTESWLISHMLAHQWFGGLVNYRSVSQAWLNEGFASYLDALWLEERDGRGHRDWRMWRVAAGIARTDDSESGLPMVHRGFAQPEDIYAMDAGKVYTKGAWVLHMLQWHLGEELFWRAVSDYLRTHAWDAVETADLRRALEEASGLDLERFFEQWVFRPGVPHLEIDYTWNAEAGQAEVTVRQTQSIGPSRPAFALDLDLGFRVAARDLRFREVLRGREHHFAYPLPGQPGQFWVDPDGRLLKTLKVGRPLEMTLGQLTHGPTLWARLDATRALAGETNAVAAATLEPVAADVDEFKGLRVEAIRRLADLNTDEAREALLRLGDRDLGDAEVRAAWVGGIGDLDTTPVMVAMLKAANVDTAPLAVQMAAVSALGEVEGPDELRLEAADSLRSALARTTRRQVRSAALRAAERLGHEALFEVIRDIAQPARGDFLRVRAISVLAGMGREGPDRDEACSMLLDWVKDPDREARVAAVKGLEEMGDASVAPVLRQALVEEGMDRVVREAIEGALRRLEAEGGREGVP